MVFICKTKEPQYFYKSDQETIEFAQRLRKMMTLSEKILWEKLRRKQLGVKFRRQHPFGRYIADFYCHEAKLVIELDGPVHTLIVRKEHDSNRDSVMEQFGVKVLRFINEEVEKNLSLVLERIKIEVSLRLNKKAK